ncbi:MAG: hypothetical protein KC589_03635, partial [Nanoarchaeota archaeon]|nr:hypothetical protein [Nanoarchaeota archaeon]
MNKKGVRKEFASGSAIYHVAKGMIFINEGLVFKIQSIRESQNNLKNIKNVDRLKKVIFEKIKNMFNVRIEHYKLTYPHLSDKNFTRIKLKEFSYERNSEEEPNDMGATQNGYFKLYPRGFRCNICGDFQLITDKNINSLHYGNCLNSNCHGKYRQIALIKFCEQCGKLDEIYYESRNKDLKNPKLKLLWESADSPSTWRFVTSDNIKTDFLKIPCSHQINKKKISLSPPKNYKAMAITSGGVVKPVVISTVDIPDIKIEHPKQDYIIWGIVMGRFDSLIESKPEDKTLIEVIDEKIKLYNNNENYNIIK